MATRFDPKSHALNQFKVLASKYFPHEYLRVSSSKKGYRLSDSTQTLIEKSKEIVSEVENSNEILPESTAIIYRYGIVFQRIFNELSKYQTISSVKSRSRRGYRKEMEFLAFDLKKIELELKKSSNPKVKIQNDGKIIREFKKSSTSLMNDEKFDVIINEIDKMQPLFILGDSEGFKYFEALSRSVSSFKQNIEKKDQLLDKMNELKSSQISLRTEIEKASQQIPNYQKEIELQREKRGVNDIAKRKENLLNHPDISLFLKILTTALERYIKMIERREKQQLEDKDKFMGLIMEPTKFDGLNETLWKEIVFIIETHGIELLSGKNWFNFSFSDDLREFITRSDILTKYSELRSIEKELENIETELIQNPSFLEAKNFIDNYQYLKDQLAESETTLPSITEEIQKLSEIIEEERIKILDALT